jgi:DNA-binding transcriptional LysR family regulator
MRDDADLHSPPKAPTMIRPIDWPIFGLKAAQLGLASRDHPVPTGGAAQPFREMGELYPRWAAEDREPLTIGLACSLNRGTARRLIGDFNQAHPEIELIVEDGDELTLAHRLKNHIIDLAIAPDGTHRRGWRSLPLWRERLIAVLPERHRLCASNEVRPEDLRDEPILLTGDGSGDRLPPGHRPSPGRPSGLRAPRGST